MAIIELCRALEPDNAATLTKRIVWWIALLSRVPTRRFWGGADFGMGDFLQPGEAPPGLEQTFPSACLPRGAKGSPEKSALADYKIRSDSWPVYQDPILNHNDSSGATPTFAITREFYNTASTRQGRAVCFCSPQIPQNQQEPLFCPTKAHCKRQFMPLQRFILILYY